MLWDVVRRIDCILCSSIFIPASSVLNSGAHINVTDDFVDDILVRISRVWLVCRFSRIRFLRFCQLRLSRDYRYCFEASMRVLPGLWILCPGYYTRLRLKY